MKAFVLLLALAFGAVAALYQLDGAPWMAAHQGRPADEAGVRPPPSAPPVTLSVTGAALDADTVQALQAEILARPLFARSRRPGDDKAAPVQQTADAAFSGGQARLIGVYLAPPVKRALVRFADSEPEWLSEGDTSRGWTVRKVSARDAVIAGASGEMTLDLHAPAN